MLFSSTEFLFLFLPATLLLYFILPRFARNSLLLAVSLLFYAWGRGSNAADGLQHCRKLRHGVVCPSIPGRLCSRLALAVAVVLNLSLLVYYKYAIFLFSNFNTLAGLWGGPQLPALSIVMPIGISFYTFQAMSYVIDVYLGTARVERNPFRLALYVALFPQLIAGPIVRYVDIADEIGNRRETLSDFASGVQRFVLGLGKKVLIANSVAIGADGIFQIPSDQLSLPIAWLGILCYALQIYFDFSGYSDMAIGLGRMFGFHFLENFNYPYFATSITDFWRRWHLSLSTWFRDYLYIPLGGNRNGTWRTYRNLLIVFLLCGFWHGASWNFVIWGGFHGGFLIAERTLFKGLLTSLWQPLRHLYAVLVVFVGWVFFRADTLEQALSFLQVMLGMGRLAPTAAYPLTLYLDSGLMLALIAGCIGSIPFLPWLQQNVDRGLGAIPLRYVRLAADGCLSLGQLVLLTAILGAATSSIVTASYNPFIYFRF